MEITLVMVGLLIIAIYCFNEFMKGLCDALEQKRQDETETVEVVVEKKGNGWSERERSQKQTFSFGGEFYESEL